MEIRHVVGMLPMWERNYFWCFGEKADIVTRREGHRLTKWKNKVLIYTSSNQNMLSKWQKREKASGLRFSFDTADIKMQNQRPKRRRILRCLDEYLRCLDVHKSITTSSIFWSEATSSSLFYNYARFLDISGWRLAIRIIQRLCRHLCIIWALDFDLST